MFHYLDYTDVCIVNTNAPKLLNTSNRYYVVTQYLNTLWAKLCFWKAVAQLDDLLLQFMILNQVTGPVKQFTSQLTVQHAQQPGCYSAWPRGERVQVFKTRGACRHASGVKRCPSETFNHLHHQPWMSHFLCSSFHYCRKGATCIPAPPLNTTPILRQMVGGMWSGKRWLSQ